MNLLSRIVLLKIVIGTVFGRHATNLKPPNGFNSIHYDDLCTRGGGSSGEKGPVSVVLRSELGADGEYDVNRDGPCICFGKGIYEHHREGPKECIYKNELNPPELPPPQRYQVEQDQLCIQVPVQSRTFKKISDEIINLETDVNSMEETKTLPFNVHFLPCNNEKVLSRRKREGEDPPPADPPADPPAEPAAEPAPSPPAEGGGSPAAPVADAGIGAPTAPVTTKLGDETDEDFLNVGTEVGHELMRSQMNLYIESVISRLTGLQGDGGTDSDKSHGKKYPALRLLEYTKQIMQKTCSVVNVDFFDLALNSFVNIQLEMFHLKEPYIGYSAFKRIELAMTRCLTRAKPHLFVANVTDTKLNGGEMCENKLPTKTGDQTVLYAGTPDEEIRNITIPEYASSMLAENKVAEPLIETVWKMLISAHSYCYMFFSDYFNDHHTYTVALLPFFTNGIQHIWLKAGEGYDLSEGNKLYGGLLGDIKKIMSDIDKCVGASREVSPYPWFMSRPLMDKSNEWRRKKRDVESDESEVESETGRVVLDDFVVAHECKQNIGLNDIC